MDATRFCYKAPCRFTVGGPLVDIHWYWVADGASTYLEPHAFPAMTGYRQFKFSDGVGEMWEAWPRHASIFAPAAFEGTAVDGTSAQFLGQAVWGPIAMGDLPACKLAVILPLIGDGGTITLLPKDVFQTQSVPLALDAIATVHDFEAGLAISLAEGQTETAVIEFFAEGVPFEGGVIAFDTQGKTPGESASVGIFGVDSKPDPPVVGIATQTAAISLDALTTPSVLPSGTETAGFKLDGVHVTPGESAVIAIDTVIVSNSAAAADATIEISGDGEPGGSSSGGGSDCDSAEEMTRGTEYTVETSGILEKWFWMSEPAFTFVHVKRLSSTAFCALDVYSGADCASKTLIASLTSDGECTQTSSMGATKVFVRLTKIGGGGSCTCTFVGDDGACP